MRFLCVEEKHSCLAWWETVFMLWISFGCLRHSDTRPHMVYRFINYEMHWFSARKACCSQDFYRSSCHCSGNSDLLTGYNQRLSLRWEPDLLLSQIFSSEVKSGIYSIRVLCLCSVGHHIVLKLNWTAPLGHLYKMVQVNYTWGQYAAITLVKLTGVFRANTLRSGTECLGWEHPNEMPKKITKLHLLFM